MIGGRNFFLTGIYQVRYWVSTIIRLTVSFVSELGSAVGHVSRMEKPKVIAAGVDGGGWAPG